MPANRQQGRVLLKQARKAIQRNPKLKGALSDPEMIRAAELTISTLKAHGVIPTALVVMRFLIEQGRSEEVAAIQAAIAETRLLVT